MANYKPDKSKMSEDRWEVYNLRDNRLYMEDIEPEDKYSDLWR